MPPSNCLWFVLSREVSKDTASVVMCGLSVHTTDIRLFDAHLTPSVGMARC